MLDRGVDAVQVGPLDPGHSYLPTESELHAFYEEVIGSIDGSCVVATHMSVGYEVPAALLVDIAGAHDEVIGINVTHLRNYVYAPQVLALAKGVSPVYLGSPVGATDGLILGASGIVSSFDINVAPQLYQDFANTWPNRISVPSPPGRADHESVLDDPRCRWADRGQGDSRPLGHRSRSPTTAPPTTRRRGLQQGGRNHRTVQPAALKETTMVEFRSHYGPVGLVTGAAGGIGGGFARELSARGLDLALTDINGPGVDATATSIRESTGRTVETIGLDMTDRSAVAALDAATTDLDVGLVICNHLRGFGHGRFLDGDIEQCHDQLEANVRAYVDLAHCFGRRLRDRGRGGIIFLSSMTGISGSPYVAMYGASKAFVLAFGSALAYELRNTGVDVLTLVPNRSTPRPTNGPNKRRRVCSRRWK